MNGIIIGDAFYNNPRTAISRSFGAHKIATMLRTYGIDVEVVDFFNSWNVSELTKIIDSYRHLIFLGVSNVYDNLSSDKASELIAYAKSKFPNIKIISGGGNITTCKIVGIDYYFRGFAEGAVPDLVNYLHNGKINPFNVLNLSNFGNKKVIDCYKHYGSYDLTKFKTIYTSGDFLRSNEGLSMELSRGCIFKCKFCTFPLVGKKKNDYIREKTDIKEELQLNYKNFGISNYSIVDDTFNDNEIKVQLLYDITKELDFTPNYMCFARVDLFHAKPHTLDLAIKAGVKSMFFGIETLNESTGKSIGKGFSGQKLKNFLLLIRDKYPDLHLTGSFIVGLPGESPEVVESNINWCLENKIFNSISLQPLGISVNNGVNLVSPLSTEWKKFNYEEMELNEIYDFLNNNSGYEEYLQINFEDEKKHNILWKNTYLNWIEAISIVKRIKNEIGNKTTMGGWNCFTTTYSRYTLDDLLKTNKNKLDWEKISYDNNEFVKDYKNKKINFILNKNSKVL